MFSQSRTTSDPTRPPIRTHPVTISPSAFSTCRRGDLQSDSKLPLGSQHLSWTKFKSLSDSFCHVTLSCRRASLHSPLSEYSSSSLLHTASGCLLWTNTQLKNFVFHYVAKENADFSKQTCSVQSDCGASTFVRGSEAAQQMRNAFTDDMHAKMDDSPNIQQALGDLWMDPQ